MATEHWSRIERLLDEALEHDPAEWPAWIEQACAGDVRLRRQLESLLARFDEARTFLKTPALDVAARLAAEARAASSVPSLEGQLVGHYRFIEPLGAGGMGEVYLAERADGEFEQRVAVKLLPPGGDPEEREHRFRSERQILASLEHPHIARLLDGGVTGEGRPYLVMEYVAGRSLTRFCDEERLGVDARLRLFLQVAAAVQHAHRSLIVHRDLKPSNILVTGEGDGGWAKLLDFGIAKLLDGTPTVSAVTRTGLRPMTPEYASPEQVRGEPVTIASDVYQLGLLLYELLTGRQPYRIEGKSPAEAERVICTQEPAPPSAVVPQQALARALRGDLDTIVLAALRKEPNHRYPTVQALTDDIERHRTGQPVAARPATAGYRARKFVGRHRWAFAAAMSFVTLLATYAVTITVQSKRIQRALDQAQTETAKAEQVAEFMTGLFEAADPTEEWGLDLTGRELLGRAARRAESLARQPEVQARLLEVLAHTYDRLAAPSSARPLVERGLAIRQELHDGDHPDVAASLHDLGTILWLMGDSSAESFLLRAIEMRRRLFGNQHDDVAASLIALGGLMADRGNHDSAQAAFRDALAIRRKTLGNGHPQTAQTLNKLGLILWEDGDADAAEPFLREALGIHRKTIGEDHVFVAEDLNNLGLVLLERGDYREAESVFRQSLAIKRRLIGDDHHFTVPHVVNLASALREQEEYVEADSLLRRAIAILEPTVDASPRHRREPTGLHERRQFMGWILLELGRLHLDRGEAATAEPILRDAVDIYTATLPKRDWRLPHAQGWLGQSLAEQGRYEEAEPLLRASQTGLEATRGPGDKRTRTAAERLAALYEAWQPKQVVRHD